MKIVIPVSGGIDSAYLLVLAKEQAHEVVPVFIKDHDVLSYENQAAFKVCRHLMGKDPVILPIPTCEQTVVQYPIEHPHLNTQDLTYWAGYKASIYHATLAYGSAIGADQVWFGTYTWNDHFVDELPANAHKFRNVWAELYPELKVPTFEFPLMGSNKVETIKKLAALDFPFEITYSCFGDYANGIRCGECLGCQDRQKSFAEANVVDPTKYQDTTFYSIEDYMFTQEQLEQTLVPVQYLFANGSKAERAMIPIKDVVNQYQYERFVQRSGVTRIGSYTGFLDNIRQVMKSNKYWREELTFLISSKGMVYPIVTLIDGDKQDGKKIIVTANEISMLDQAQDLWLKGQNTTLDEFGLQQKTEGNLETSIVNVWSMTKRFRRYLNKFDYVLHTNGQDLANKLGIPCSTNTDLTKVLERYHQDAVAYWAKRGKLNSLGDNYKFFPNHGVILVEISGEGVAYLSQTIGGRYWDFSLRKDTPNVGNALLQKSCEIIKQLGETYLDLGVSFFDWKDAWTQERRKYKGIEFINKDFK